MLDQIKKMNPDKASCKLEVVNAGNGEFRSLFREALAGDESTIIADNTEEDSVMDFARATAAGLSRSPRRLESKYLYDAQGSSLFDQITQQPEYYLTETEAKILRAKSSKIREITGPVTLVELGSGSAVKTDFLLRAWLARGPSVTYVPVDVSESALVDACKGIRDTHFSARVIGVNAEYQIAFPMIREASPVMVLFLGSSIGNFHRDEESRFLSELASCLLPGDFFLLGIDLVKDHSIVEAAYNDAAGVTAGFTKNLFARMNRELGSDIDLSAVEHVARYDSVNDFVDIRAHFNHAQNVNIEPIGESFTIGSGEMIGTEISKKYCLKDSVPYLESFGFKAKEVFTDERGWFALVLLRRSGSNSSGWRI